MLTLKHTLTFATVMLFTIFLAGTLLAQEEMPVEIPTETSIVVATSTSLPPEAPTSTPESVSEAAPVVAAETAEVQPVSITSFSPAQFVQGAGGTVTISGANFTASTTVSLGSGVPLVITSQSVNTLVATVPGDVAAGSYTVQLSDLTGGTTIASSLLTIIAPTAIPQLSVSQTEPAVITYGTTGNLSVLGANFTSNTTVRLAGYGFLTVTYVNSGALKAALPTGIPAGTYVIEVSDPSAGTAVAPGMLTINAIAVTATPVPTATLIPGEPELIINLFSASPAAIYPGGTTQLTFTVMNAGSRTAGGVVVAPGNGEFAPANGVSSLTLPDLAPGTSYTVSLAVTAPMNAASGAQNIPIVMTSRDSTGQTYTDNGVVSVTIAEDAAGIAQVVLDSYLVTPNTANSGDSVTLQALFRNTGTETAEQVLVQLDGSNSVLLAGSQGSAFSLGDLPAGATVPVVMPLVVSGTAEAGAQAQSFSISYLQDGEMKQGSASISLTVVEATEADPLILLQSYDAGQVDPLQPGQQFTYSMTLQNAGVVDVSNLLVTFGTVSLSSSASGSTSGSETNSAGVSTTATTSSASFAIYGSGGTILLGSLAAGSTAEVTQEFIVSSDLTSGIHSLPVTLQYTTPDGTAEQQSLEPGLIVLVPPRLRVTAEDLPDDPLITGEETTLTVNLANTGSAAVSLTEMHVSGDNVEISTDETIVLDPLDGSDDTSESITFTPTEAGEYTLTIAVDYIDDLNRIQTITQVFSGTVEAAQQPTRPAGMTRPTLPQQQNDNLLGRLLLGFLGFGG